MTPTTRGALQKLLTAVVVLLLFSSAVVSGVTVDGLESTATTDSTTAPTVDSLSNSESKIIQSYLQSEQVGYVSDPIRVDGTEYVGVLIVRANGVPAELRDGSGGSYASGYYSDEYWGESGIRNILVFEKSTSGVQLVTDTDTIEKVLEARTGEELADFYSHPQIEQWITDWTDRVIHSPGSKAAFGWEKVTRLESREDAYLASLQGMTTAGSQAQYVPESVREELKHAETAAEAASIATDVADRLEVGSKVEVAGEAVDSQKTKQALQMFSDDITYVSENADKVAYAGSLVSLVLAVSEQQVYADYKIERFKRVQEYAHTSPDVELDDDLDGAITRLIDMHEDSDQKTREALLTWIDTSSVDLATTAAPTVAQKFGSWVVTKSSYAASASTYATSGTAGTLLSGAASVAGAGLVGWQIGGVLINRQGMYVTMKRAEFSQKTMNELGKVTDAALETHGSDFKRSGSVDAYESRVFYSAAALEKLAQVQTYRYVSESFDSTWVDDRLGDVEELIRLLEGNEYVSDEKVVEDAVDRTERQYGRWNQTSIAQTLEAYPTEPNTVASLSTTLSSTVVSPSDELWVEAGVTNRAGQPVDADQVSYEIVETEERGSLLGQNGEYSYGVEVPQSTGEYTIQITAQVNDQSLSKTRKITVSDGDIGVSTGSISGKAFPGETITQQIRITNNGQTTLSNVEFSERGSQRNWISVSSSEPDWRARSQSFEAIQPTSNDARTVTVGVAVPTSADQGTYNGAVAITTNSGGSVDIPVSLSVTEQSDRIEQDDDGLYDSGPNGWDVSAEVTRDGTVPEWTDAGNRDTIRTSSVTIDDSWTEVGSFSADDVGIDEMANWIATDIDWTAGPDADDGYLQIRINGESNEETHRVAWGGSSAQPYHLEDYQIPTITRDENTVEFKYIHSDRSSVTLSDVVVEPETAELDRRIWADDAYIDDEELATVRNAYLSLDAKAMSDATAHPLRIYVNGEFQGTVSAPYDDWTEDQRVTIDTAALSTDPEVEIRTRPKGIYNVDDVELVYSYIEPADIDTDLSTDEISVTEGEQFTVSGTVLNDGGMDAADTDYSLSYDTSLLTLVRGSESGSLGTLTAGESARQTWTFRADSGGSSSLTLTGDAETSDESASASVTIPTYGVTVSGPEPVTTENDSTTATFTITNTGSVEESINLNASIPSGPTEWAVTPDQRRVSIPSGGSVQVPVSITAPRLGQGDVTLAATPSAISQTATDTVSVTRQQGPDETPPSVRVNAPETVTSPNATVTWIGIDNRDPQERLLYSYRVGGTGAQWSAWTNTTSATLADLDVGTQQVTIRVKDSAGNVGSTTTEIRFNPSPEAALSVPEGPVQVGNEVVLDASGSSDPADADLSYTWDVDGDGTFDNSSGETLRHSFDSAGQYEILIQVSDGESTDTARATVTVTRPKSQLEPALTLTSPSTETPAKISETAPTFPVEAQVSFNGSRSKQTIQTELDNFRTGGRVVVGTELASTSTVSVESLRRNRTANQWVAELEVNATVPPLSDGVYDLQAAFPVTKNCQQICTQEVRMVTDTVDNAVVYRTSSATPAITINQSTIVRGEPVELGVTTEQSGDQTTNRSYNWTITGSSNITDQAMTGSEPAVTFDTAGDQHISVSLTTTSGETISTTKTVTVREPTERMSPELRIQSPPSGAAVIPSETLTATYQTETGAINGSVSVGETSVPITEFAANGQITVPVSEFTATPGTYTLSMRIEDKQNRSVTADRQFTIAPLNSGNLTISNPSGSTIRVSLNTSRQVDDLMVRVMNGQVPVQTIAGTELTQQNGSYVTDITAPHPGRLTAVVTTNADDGTVDEHLTDTVTVVPSDTTPPALGATLARVNASTAQVSLTASEPLADGTASVSIRRPDGTTVSPELRATPNGFSGYFELVSADGAYRLTVVANDTAGNRGQSQAVANIESVATENKTVTVQSEQSGVFIQFNTTATVSDSYVTVTTSETPLDQLPDRSLGVSFLEGELGQQLSQNLSNATIGIPVNQNRLPAEMSPEDVSIRRYDAANDSWIAYQTTVQAVTVNNSTDEYWVATVPHFSTYGAVADDTTSPKITTATPNGQLNYADTSPIVSFEYNDTESGIDTNATTVFLNNEPTAESRTLVGDRLAMYQPPELDPGETYNVTIQAVDVAGNVNNATATFSVPEDTTEPTVTDRSPANGTELSPTTKTRVALVYRDNETGIDVQNISVTLNGQDITDAASINDTHVVYELPELSPGTSHTLSAGIPDQATASNTATPVVTFSVSESESTLPDQNETSNSAGTDPNSTESTSSSGGGGGGAAGQLDQPTSVETNVIDLDNGATARVGEVPGGETVTINTSETVSGEGVTLDAVEISHRLGSADYRVEMTDVSDSPPPATPSVNSGITIGYLTVDPIGAESVQRGELSVGVADSELPTAASTDDVVLYHYDDGWEPLPTRHVRSANGQHQFTAVTDGFSPFAIGTQMTEIAVTDATVATETLAAGETAEITATVSNDGTAAGSTTVTLRLEGETVAEQQLEVAGEETTEVTLKQPIDQPGDYTVRVNDVDAGTISVEQAEEQPNTTDSQAENESGTGTTSANENPITVNVPGFGVLVTLVAMFIATMVAARKE